MEKHYNHSNKLSLYWKCQLIGWSLASLYWLFTALFMSRVFDLTAGLIHFIFDVVIGIALTHIYRSIAKKNQWGELATSRLIWYIIPAIVLMAFLYMILICGKLYLINAYYFFPKDSSVKIYPAEMTVSFKMFLTYNGLNIFMTGLRLMSIWVLAYHLYLYAKREIRATKENAALVLAAKETQLINLSAQLNPHFLFNSLNNIKALVIDDPKAARRGIDLLSELLRISLYRNQVLLIPIKDELSLVKDYLELEKLRFGARMESRIESDQELDEVMIPPLSIHTLVENAIKHGIANEKDGGIIRIGVKKAGEELQISVLSPGTLDPEKGCKGLGLRNLEERLALQYEGKASVALMPFDHQIVLANIIIPLA
ncbi:sensor histidine kinase [Pedobacter caeni]|uniref:Histidine kinase n=1 Tax=Pedobacter caeni TaxID=288992 RepID=A0A1M5LC92_9SPHI|nr:histidine kinase [Pedobacter caeni]SHG62661.1 Histidine kinase [Pedobacter caeni]